MLDLRVLVLGRSESLVADDDWKFEVIRNHDLKNCGRFLIESRGASLGWLVVDALLVHWSIHSRVGDLDVTVRQA